MTNEGAYRARESRFTLVKAKRQNESAASGVYAGL